MISTVEIPLKSIFFLKKLPYVMLYYNKKDKFGM